MTFRLVRDLAAEGVPAAVACRVLHVSESGYHAAKSRPPSRRETADKALTATLHEIHRDSRGTYGVRRVHAELRLGRQLTIGHGRVERLMRQAGLQGVHHRRWRRSGGNRLPAVFQDHVQRQFVADRPDKLWVTDITQHRTGEGWVYCAAVIDVFSRRCVGWSIADHLRTELVLDAVDMARIRRRPEGTVLHSDRGTQFGFNRSSQHLEFVEVSVGSSSAGSRSGAASETSIAGASEVPAVGGCGVLARDREGAAARGGVCGCWRGAGGRRALVPQRWRYAAVRFQRAALGSLPVLRGA